MGLCLLGCVCAAKLGDRVVELRDELQRGPPFGLDGLERAPGGVRFALQVVEFDYEPPIEHPR
jgi:hypothetical protein